ncbi:MAG TPA: hypothetical protein VHO69_10855 [Phototrophicaceae bacterium]|nr:hypothetical protein [Phototrophicaceae bacterium]
MSQQTSVLQPATFLSWKTLWRADAVANLITGDILLFATTPVINLVGMAENTAGLVQGLGVLLAFYGLWQLWAAHSGAVSRQSYLVGAMVMDIMGVALLGMLVSGVTLNPTGMAITIALIAGAWIGAVLWWIARRQTN